MSKTQDEIYLGIDLGTMFSCIGILRSGKVEMVVDVADGSIKKIY